MIFAVLGDIKGSFCAVSAVLHTLADQGIHTIFQTGNALIGGDDALDILQLFEEYDVKFVQGSDERALAQFIRKRDTFARRIDPDFALALENAADTLPSETLEYLRKLPHLKHITLEGLTIALCHGAPSSQRTILTAETSQLKLEREREVENAGIIVCGGADTPFNRRIADTLFVAPGRCYDHGDAAHYTLVNTETETWEVEQRIIAIET